MNKKEFLEKLRQGLHKLPRNDIDDIIRDYEEHFRVGLEKGETDESMIKNLGNPLNIAQSYYSEEIYEQNTDRNKLAEILKSRKLQVSLLQNQLLGIAK